MHKNHLIGCGIGITLALGIVLVAGVAPAGLALLLAALVCPLAMVVAMKLLMGGGHQAHLQPADAPVGEPDGAPHR